MKWVTGKYNDSLTDQLTATGWLSVYQLAVYHSLVLYWKVTFHNKPIRLITRINIARETEARIQLTERIWSRTSERLFRRVKNYLIGVTKISSAKNILRKWVKTNIPISEDWLLQNLCKLMCKFLKSDVITNFLHSFCPHKNFSLCI